MDTLIEQPINSPTPVRYVTYDADGVLDGCYCQVPGGDHVERMILIDEATAADWPHYRANDARDGVEPVPPAPPVPPPASPSVPSSVTRRQARQALLLAGLLDNVPAAIALLDDGTPEGNQQMRLAQIEWEDSLEFERARPLVIKIGLVIGLDASKLDELFIKAAAL